MRLQGAPRRIAEQQRLRRVTAFRDQPLDDQPPFGDEQPVLLDQIGIETDRYASTRGSSGPLMRITGIRTIRSRSA